jgi:pilus assembly protein Flp/PilA
MNKLAEFLSDESGATAIEYGLVAAMIAVGIIVAMTSFGTSLLGLFNYVSERSQTAMGS